MELANDVDEFECGASFVAESPETRQHFFFFSVVPRAYEMRERIASFFSIFFSNHQSTRINTNDEEMKPANDANRREIRSREKCCPQCYSVAGEHSR
jgi:hypothetical protein